MFCEKLKKFFIDNKKYLHFKTNQKVKLNRSG